VAVILLHDLRRHVRTMSTKRRCRRGSWAFLFSFWLAQKRLLVSRCMDAKMCPRTDPRNDPKDSRSLCRKVSRGRERADDPRHRWQRPPMVRRER